MAIYLVTWGFSGIDTGWGETLACRQEVDSPSALAQLAVAVAQKRVTFLGKEFGIKAIRISKYSDTGGTQRQLGKFNLRQGFSNPVQTDAMASEPKQVAYYATATTSAALAPAALANNSTRAFLGGPIDSTVDFGGLVDPNKANLGTNFTQWATLVVQNNFGWLADSRQDDRPISSISQNTNGTVTIVTGAGTNTGFTPVIGTVYPARIRGVNLGRSPMNGQAKVTYTATNTWVTTEVIGLALFQQGGRMRLYNPISPFCGFNSLVLQLESAEHKRGLPFGFSRGRARNRIRG